MTAFACRNRQLETLRRLLPPYYRGVIRTQDHEDLADAPPCTSGFEPVAGKSHPSAEVPECYPQRHCTTSGAVVSKTLRWSRIYRTTFDPSQTALDAKFRCLPLFHAGSHRERAWCTRGASLGSGTAGGLTRGSVAWGQPPPAQPMEPQRLQLILNLIRQNISGVHSPRIHHPYGISLVPDQEPWPNTHGCRTGIPRKERLRDDSSHASCIIPCR